MNDNQIDSNTAAQVAIKLAIEIGSSIEDNPSLTDIKNHNVKEFYFELYQECYEFVKRVK